MLIRGLPFHLACLPKFSKSLILGDILSLYVAVIGVKAVKASGDEDAPVLVIM